MSFDKEKWRAELNRLEEENEILVSADEEEILALLERAYAEGRASRGADWDLEQSVEPKPDESGLECIARWVREYKAELEKRGDGIFDSTLQCISEGGEVFYVDPEEIERAVEALAAARKATP